MTDYPERPECTFGPELVLFAPSVAHVPAHQLLAGIRAHDEAYREDQGPSPAELVEMMGAPHVD